MLLRYSLQLEPEARALEAAVSAALIGGARPADLVAAGAPAVTTRAAGDAVVARSRLRCAGSLSGRALRRALESRCEYPQPSHRRLQCRPTPAASPARSRRARATRGPCRRASS